MKFDYQILMKDEFRWHRCRGRIINRAMFQPASVKIIGSSITTIDVQIKNKHIRIVRPREKYYENFLVYKNGEA